MTQEEKFLLLKDLSARLPYGVMVQCITESARRANASPLTETLNTILYRYVEEDNIELKPYLHPMSSMTEEENKIYQSKQTIIFDFKNNKLYVDNCYSLDYLNSIHVDYRELIKKGLALEAPEGMYNLNKE